jgi:hypothetical protein
MRNQMRPIAAKQNRSTQDEKHRALFAPIMQLKLRTIVGGLLRWPANLQTMRAHRIPIMRNRCMTRQSSKTWSDDELKKLKDYADAGASHYRTAAALNRTVSGVRSMAQRHGIRFISPKTARHAAGSTTHAPLS